MSASGDRLISVLVSVGFLALLVWGCATSGVWDVGGWVFEGDDVIVVQAEGRSAQEETARHAARTLRRMGIAVDTATQNAGYLRTAPIPINDTLSARLNLVATDTSAIEIAGEYLNRNAKREGWRRYDWDQGGEVWNLMQEVATALGSIEGYEEDPDGYGTIACGGRRCADGQVCRSNVCRDEPEGSEGSQSPALTKVEGCLSGNEQELLSRIHKYRQENGLPRLPAAKSLTKVARVHVRDLASNEPHREGRRCNAHSWSDQGNWTPCCYTPDHAEAECMWNKPKELTSYEGLGFEVWAGGWASDGSAAEGALSVWKSSPGHNKVIINRGRWATTQWEAIGVGIYDGHAVAWFGKQSPIEKSLPCAQ